MIILGIDPGIAKVGFAVIRKNKGSVKEIHKDIKCLDYGCITTSPKLSTPERLKKIADDLKKLIKEYNPKILAVENVYFFKNLKTALPVSQAKGVILLAAAQNNIPVHEFTPLQVKMAVSGYGRADKAQIQNMTQILFNLAELPKPDDAADALAVAACYAFSIKKL